MLVEYLAERYGDKKVRDLWTRVHDYPADPATTDLEAVIDVPLATFYSDFANKRLSGDFTFAPLKGALPATIGGFVVGNVDDTSDDLNVAVNLYASRYLSFHHASDVGACYEARLTINVKIPDMVDSHPAYYAGTAGATVPPLSVSGSNASIAVPWNTCSGSPDA
jgi:hypothetical protein